MRTHMMGAGLLLLTITTGNVLISCGGSSECVGDIPVPKLQSVQPMTVNSQDPSTTLSLSGSGFSSSSKVYLNSMLLASTVIDSHHITATVTSEALFVAGTSSGVQIWVTNPGQIGGGLLGCSNGGSSKSISLTVT
ncbi:MAG TPA: hypothetical protein VMG82_25590 [Candidatus Sulfotelmatobacter sp.]|nr:hypothetical protein [Candidatus Sulfotelmatobacter sp.]